uniref:hypothetical protein n=1 Tax=Gemmiger formicilis TaxID=745368 RepID=UPI0040284EBD
IIIERAPQKKRRARFFWVSRKSLPPGGKKDFWGSQNFSLKFGKRYKKQQKCDLWLTFCQFYGIL